MGQLQLSFDRGTLRLDGAVGALADVVRFDRRAGFHRASGHLYTALLDLARERGLEVDDRIATAWPPARTPSAPPELRPYQAQALAAFERLGWRGVIALPTGSGKTRTACAALARSGQSAVVLVPTRVLLDQWISVLRAQFGDPMSGLLCTCGFSERGTRLEVSGPLSILRHTTKYGFALASFFPAVVVTPGFRMQALCVLKGESFHLEMDASDRIARTHRLPRDADSAVERALARDVRRLGTEWSLSRESHMLALGARAVFPDFSLHHARGFTVLVEVVGFYTPEYLRSKLETLRAAAADPLIVCIDEALACADGEVPGTVLRFRRRIDAAKLIEAAERLREGQGA